MLTEEDALAMLREKLAAAAELSDDVCGGCRKPYSVHCSECHCCPGTGHEDMCGW